MTVKQLLQEQYKDYMKNIHESAWKYCCECAAAKKMHVADYILINYICITEYDLKKNGVSYSEAVDLNKSKLLASNRHRQEHGHVDAFWLTKKGIKWFNEG